MSFAVGGLVAGAAVGALLWALLGSWLWRPRLLRTNYRGHELPTAAGLFTVLGSATVLAVMMLVGHSAAPARTAVATLIALGGFAALGLYDDLFASTSGGGFGGHLRALVVERRITTGLVKLVGGAVLSMGAVASAIGSDNVDGGAVLDIVRGGALVALAANLLNLFDRAPARATKVAGVWWGALLGFTWALDQPVAPLAWSAAVVGAAAGLMVSEVAERHMQGDTGVNALGAAVGLATVLVGSAWVESTVLAVLLALNLASERVSFTSVIDGSSVLRKIDRVGSPYRRG